MATPLLEQIKALNQKVIMKRKGENAVGEPGQFKTTPVIGFTPTDHTPTKSPATDREIRKRSNSRRPAPAKESARTGSAEKELKKRVLRHRRKGLDE
jgi:hypothetical protein